MLEFEILAMKAKTDDMYVIFLLKKNVKSDIIKTILEYLPIAVPEILKKQKVVITSVRQEYKSTESRHDYKTKLEIIYEKREVPIVVATTSQKTNSNTSNKF